MEKEILEERERIKEIVEKKKTSVEMICQNNFEKSHRKRSLHSIAKSITLRIFDDLIFLIDNPGCADYQEKEVIENV